MSYVPVSKFVNKEFTVESVIRNWKQFDDMINTQLLIVEFKTANAKVPKIADSISVENGILTANAFDHIYSSTPSENKITHIKLDYSDFTPSAPPYDPELENLYKQPAPMQPPPPNYRERQTTMQDPRSIGRGGSGKKRRTTKRRKQNRRITKGKRRK